MFLWVEVVPRFAFCPRPRDRFNPRKWHAPRKQMHQLRSGQRVHPNFLGLRRLRTFEYCPSTVFQGLQSGLRRFSMVWFWIDFRGPENGGHRASGK